MTSRPANAEQAYRWNGEGGRYWIDHRERLLAGHWAATAEQYAARQQADGVWVEAAAFLVTARRG